MRRIIGLLLWLYMAFLVFVEGAYAQYFTAVPNPFFNGQVSSGPNTNANYAQLVTQGNAAIASIQSAINGIATKGVPISAIMAQLGTTCPSGWVVADGHNSIPDLRGVYVRGWDNGAGVDPGRTLGSYQADMFLQHSHGAIPSLSGITSILYGSNANSGTIPNIGVGSNTSISGTSGVISGGDTETRPNTIVYTYCYKNALGGGGGISSAFSPSPVNLSAYSTIPPAEAPMADFNQIIADGNTAFTNLQTQITNFSGGGSVPSNAIVAFWAVACPTGWVAADGTGGTPDMRGYFASIGLAGSISGTHIADTLFPHQHNFGPMPLFATTFNTNTMAFPSTGSIAYSNSVTTGGGTIGNATTGNFGTETRPKNVALLYCMKS